MLRYVIKRIGIGLVTLLALVVVTFLLVHLMPGNPFDIANLTPSNQEEMMHHYGLDRPVTEQLGQYLVNLLHGNFGISFKKSGVSVSELIVEKAPTTMRLGGIAFLAALVLGTLLGIRMAVTGREFVRGSILTFTTLGISVPNYVLALILMLVFGVRLKLFPVLGLGTPMHYVLPVTAPGEDQLLRGHAAGLCRDGKGQGPRPPAHHHAARAEKRDDPGDHRGGADDRLSPDGKLRGGDDLHHPRHRP